MPREAKEESVEDFLVKLIFNIYFVSYFCVIYIGFNLEFKDM